MGKRVWKDDAAFRPWERDRRRGVRLVLAGLALGLLAGLAFASGLGVWSALPGLIALAFLGAGANALKRAANRAFGKHFEGEWTARAIRDLGNEFSTRANVRAAGGGDADLIVTRLADRAVIVVEIKSFRYWKAPFFGLFPGERERKSIAQARRLSSLTGATAAVVWLPQGSPTIWQRLFPPRREGVRVIFGGTGPLRRRLRDHSG